jgi:hypothetical protein
VTRKYSSISVQQLLDSTLSAGATTLALDDTAAVTALLGGVSLAGGNVDQFTIVVDPDTAQEEIIFVRGTSGATLTGLVRGQAGTSDQIHNAGATVKHVLTSNDLDYYTTGVDAAITAAGTATLTNKVIDASNNTLTGVVTLTGTQTLTNKTLTSPTADDPKLNLSVNAQTGTTYTFVLADNGKFVTASNSSAQTYSIPTNASVAFPVGTQIHIIQIGTGQVTIQAVTSGTTTVLSTGGTAAAPKIAARYGAATCIKTATDTWYVIGNLS